MKIIIMKQQRALPIRIEHSQYLPCPRPCPNLTVFFPDTHPWHCSLHSYLRETGITCPLLPLTALLPVGYSWTRHQIASFFSPSILYKATLIAEILLVSGGISLNPVPISLCMFGFLTASKGCCSEVNNTAPRPKKKEKKERSLQEPLKRAELLWDQCDKVSHSFKKGALLSRTSSLHRTYSFSGK